MEEEEEEATSEMVPGKMKKSLHYSFGILGSFPA